MSNLRSKLLSVASMDDASYFALIGGGSAQIMSKAENEKIYAKGVKYARRLYRFKFIPVKDNSVFAVDSYYLWHKRFAYLNKNDYGKLKSLGLINYKADNEMCGNCIFGKQCKLPPKMKHSKSNRSL